MMLPLSQLRTQLDEPKCKGLIFKGKSSLYVDGRGIHEKKSLILMKRMSCSGCKYCEWQYDYLKEDISSSTFCNSFLADIVNGNLYTVSFKLSKPDWDGEVDVEYDITEYNP